jgi:hypothetical protein
MAAAGVSGRLGNTDDHCSDGAAEPEAPLVPVVQLLVDDDRAVNLSAARRVLALAR